MARRKAKPQADHRTMEQTIASWGEKKRLLLDELPKHGYDWVKAGLAAGYSQGYTGRHLKNQITKDETFCNALLAKRHEIEAKTGDKREKVERYLLRVVDAEGIAHRDRIMASQTLSRMNGWDQQTIVLERGDRLRELETSEQAEAKRLAALRFDTLSLPGDYSARCITKAMSSPANAEQTACFEAESSSEVLSNQPANEQQGEVEPVLSDNGSDDSTHAGTLEQACGQAGRDDSTSGAGQAGATPSPPSGAAAYPSPVHAEIFLPVPKGTLFIDNQDLGIGVGKQD